MDLSDGTAQIVLFAGPSPGYEKTGMDLQHSVHDVGAAGGQAARIVEFDPSIGTLMLGLFVGAPGAKFELNGLGKDMYSLHYVTTKNFDLF